MPATIPQPIHYACACWKILYRFFLPPNSGVGGDYRVYLPAAFCVFWKIGHGAWKNMNSSGWWQAGSVGRQAGGGLQPTCSFMGVMCCLPCSHMRRFGLNCGGEPFILSPVPTCCGGDACLPPACPALGGGGQNGRPGLPMLLLTGTGCAIMPTCHLCPQITPCCWEQGVLRQSQPLSQEQTGQGDFGSPPCGLLAGGDLLLPLP